MMPQNCSNASPMFDYTGHFSEMSHSKCKRDMKSPRKHEPDLPQM